MKSVFEILNVVFITDPLLHSSKESKEYRVFINTFWLFLKEYFLEHDKYCFFYVEFLLNFLCECQNNNFESNECKKRVMTCSDVIEILKEILPLTLSEKKSKFDIDNTLIISFVEKISLIYGKSSICAMKSNDMLKYVLSHPFILSQITTNEEVLSYIFENCFTLEKQNFFLLFLSLCCPKLQILSNDASFFKNIFFGNLRKQFTFLMKESDEDQNLKLKNKIENWKVIIFCKLFQNILCSDTFENDFSK